MLTDKADGVVVADAIRFVGPQSGGSAASAARAPQPAAVRAHRPRHHRPRRQPAAQPPRRPLHRATAPNDARYFPQTGYRISEDAFWNYFRARGGVRTFGYPVSNAFMLYGHRRSRSSSARSCSSAPTAACRPMNLLDDGLLPVHAHERQHLPRRRPERHRRSRPTPDAPDYHAKALDFVRAMAPDTFDGEPVNFAKTFFGSVRAEDAYPNGVPAGGDALLPYFNLEIWGLPTSKPTHDPNNPNFIYQRFQRGIMHYDKGCGCTQGLLLADYVKSLLTGKNLPPDLARSGQGQQTARPVQARRAAVAGATRAICLARTCPTAFANPAATRPSRWTPATAAPRSAPRTPSRTASVSPKRISTCASCCACATCCSRPATR